MTGHVLDLTVNHFVRELGDLVVIGTWYGATREELQPCIVIAPRYRLGVGRSRPGVIPLEFAYRYRDPAYLLLTARNFADGLGLEDNSRNVNRIADIIHSSLDDLRKIPPRPVLSTEHVATATVTHHDGRIVEHEVTEDI